MLSTNDHFKPITVVVRAMLMTDCHVHGSEGWSSNMSRDPDTKNCFTGADLDGTVREIGCITVIQMSVLSDMCSL